MQTHQPIDFQASKASEQPTPTKEGPVTVSKFFTHEERVEFYNGKERLTLQEDNLQKVRALQEANDALQRQILSKQKALSGPEDALTVLADIEHYNIMISRNLGEIINVYAQNEQRLKRLAHLEAQNENLKQEMLDTQHRFSHCHEMQLRSKIAAEFFLAKTYFQNNLEEIEVLNRK